MDERSSDSNASDPNSDLSDDLGGDLRKRMEKKMRKHSDSVNEVHQELERNCREIFKASSNIPQKQQSSNLTIEATTAQKVVILLNSDVI